MQDKQQTTIAMQVGAVSFVDEGVEQVLDNLQELGGVNTLFLANFTYTRGTGGRQLEGHPLPDHGKMAYDPEFVGGNYGIAHPQYYNRTFIRPEQFRAKEHGDYDMMAEVIPEAKRRGMKSYCWIEESSGLWQSQTIPNYAQLLEQDPRGISGRKPCFNHPEYRNWHFSLIEDYIKSYEVDGVAWCSERQGPLGNLFGGPWATGEVTCFCPHCRARARELGINVERARQGYIALRDFIHKARADVRPNDGYFVMFWRLLLRYPEILAWENHWHEGQRQFFKEIYGMVKAINPEVQVGWHVFHLNSLSPFYRATQDLSEMSHYSDFIKLVAYNNCAGPRFADYMKHLHSTIFRDAAPQEALQLIYRFLGIAEGSLEDIPQQGWSADYVRRETQRAVQAVKLSGCPTRIYPGIDVDIPTGQGLKQTEPQDVYESVTAAMQAGAQGVVLSRKYSEMRLANLEACGKALKDLSLL
ncbi:hypothetical protein [Paenibacillus thalictri]|uniref:Uncharacterized protein n=1 Tax=Paenibacillus thalictri TaxID=2527873 RepID=A0A4Q9DJG3_9BACL|nr:hypothetical protein [Paenibacillus thalictri]TBL71573.1 hypothetical protein EYB31_29795 [Paenibacillus thalictri]